MIHYDDNFSNSLGGICIEIIDINDSIYPSKLRNIPNPPKSLYVEGNTDLLSHDSIAIIGSRACSENGVRLTHQFANELSHYGITIISGLAKRYRYICSFGLIYGKRQNYCCTR